MELVDRDVPGPRRDFVGYGKHPPKVVWPEDAKLVVNFCVNFESGSENSQPAGDGRNEGLGEVPYCLPPEYRDFNSETVYEYGSRAGVFRLLRLFDEYRVKTTFFAAAVAVERTPDVGAWIQEAGHEACGHGWRWTEHWLLSREEEETRLRWAIDSLTRTCGERPVGWSCRYSPSPNTRELLVAEGGFLYDSDSYNDDLPYFVEVEGTRHLVIPYSFVYNDGRYVSPQGFGSPAEFVDVCRRGIDELLLEGRSGHPKMISIGLHPRWAGQPGRSSAVRELIEYGLGQGDVLFATRADIARWWIAHHESFER